MIRRRKTNIVPRTKLPPHGFDFIGPKVTSWSGLTIDVAIWSTQ